MGSVQGTKRGIASGVRATIINTSIVASIPLVLAVMTTDIPYYRLINIIGNVNTLSNSQITTTDLAPLLMATTFQFPVVGGLNVNVSCEVSCRRMQLL